MCANAKYRHDILSTNNNLSASERRKMKVRMEELITYQSHYELTENLLNQFKVISPGLSIVLTQSGMLRGDLRMYM